MKKASHKQTSFAKLLDKQYGEDGTATCEEYEKKVLKLLNSAYFCKNCLKNKV